MTGVLDLPGEAASTRAEPRTVAVDVTVLTPVLNEEAHLAEASARMLAQRFDGEVEFLFIDGGSQDASPQILQSIAAADPRVRLLHNPAQRTPQALNLGLRQARGTYIARMDAHAHYPSDYLALGVARLRQGDVVSVSGPQLASGQSRWARRIALALSTPLGSGGATFRRDQGAETEVDSGFTGVWCKDVLVACGGWDEEWLNDQDTELAARLRAQGGRIVCVPAMAASYVPRDSLRELARQYSRYGWYRVKTSHRHPASLRRSQLLPAGVALAALTAPAGPRAMRRAGRVCLGAYGVAVAAACGSAARRARATDVAALPVVYVTMHVSYGLAFLQGCFRHGIPTSALASALSPRRKQRSP